MPAETADRPCSAASTPVRSGGQHGGIGLEQETVKLVRERQSAAPAGRPRFAAALPSIDKDRGAAMARSFGQLAVPGDELPALAVAADPFQFAAIGPSWPALRRPARA